MPVDLPKLNTDPLECSCSQIFFPIRFEIKYQLDTEDRKAVMKDLFHLHKRETFIVASKNHIKVVKIDLEFVKLQQHIDAVAVEPFDLRL